jgi:antirestriction protein
MAGIDHMLAASPDPGAEEWAIHDYDGFGSLRLSEFEPLSVVSAIAQGIAAHGPAFAAWADLVDKEPERLQHFGDAYQGTWPTRTAYAEELLDDMGAEDQLDRSVEAWLRPYVHIDYEDFGRDMELGGDYEGKEADDGTLYIFDSRS